MNTDLKRQLHNLIDGCNDPFLLEEAKTVLESNQSGEAFLDELDDEDKEAFIEGEEEHDLGHSVTHSRLMHQFGSWKKK